MSLTDAAPSSLQFLKLLKAINSCHPINDQAGFVLATVCGIFLNCGAICLHQIFQQVDYRAFASSRVDGAIWLHLVFGSWVPITSSRSTSSLNERAITSILAKSDEVAFNFRISDLV